MDRPAVDRIDGVPPAIAIDQTNPVRTSRSTVGTMTELNDHLKLLFARAAQLFDQRGAAGAPRHAGHDLRRPAGAPQRSRRPAPGRHLSGRAAGQHTPPRSRAMAVGQRLHARAGRAQGRNADRAAKLLDVVADRFRIGTTSRRCARSRRSSGAASAAAAASMSTCCERRGARPQRPGASRPACTAPTATCATPTRSPALFSFNSPVGACETCRGFGRVIGIDYGLVIPDDTQDACATARSRPIQTPAWKEMPGRPDEVRRQGGIPRDTAVARAHRGAAALGHRRLAELEGQVEPAVVRRASASSTGSRSRPTRCTSACCSRGTAAIRRARRATARA